MSLTPENLPNAAKGEDGVRIDLYGIQTTNSAGSPWGVYNKLLFIRTFKVLLILWSELKHYFLVGTLPDTPYLMWKA